MPKKPTKAQIRANRENAKKSTGPRTETEEGKARVSLNALKHGLLAQDAVLPSEDPAEFDRQLRDLEHDLRPENSLEFELVRQIADAQWRMRRLVRIETAFLAGAIEAQRSHAEIFHPDNIQPGREGESQLLGAGLLGRTQALLHLARYDAHLSRRYYRAIAELGRLRKLERAAEQYCESKTTKQSQYPEPYEESARYEPPSGPQGWTPTGGQGPHSRPPPQPPILPRLCVGVDLGPRRWFCGFENVATQSRKRSGTCSMVREPVSEDVFAVAEAPMLSSPMGCLFSFLKML